MIEPGQELPDATLSESTEFGEACPLSPKKIAVFALPGAYTPTCSAQHVPGYVKHLDALRAKGVDEVWCVSVNDGYVMAAWGRDQDAMGKIRFLGDGSGELTQKLGLDVTIPGMGMRMKRASLLVVDGVVKAVHVEAPGKFEVSNAETMLRSL